MNVDKNLICGAILFALCLISKIRANYKSRPSIYRSTRIAKRRRKKPPVYDKTIYKPRKPENKDLPHGDFTHEHVESMWDEIK